MASKPNVIENTNPKENNEQIILYCLRHNLETHQTNLPDISEGVNWDSLFQVALDQRSLGSMLSVEKEKPGFWPEQFKKKITSYRFSLMLNSSDAVEKILSIIGKLNKKKIPVIVIKGWEYMQTVYSGNYSLRPCGDIDILIHPQDLARAEAVLADAGFEPTIELWPGFRYRHHNVAHHYQVKDHTNDEFNFGVDLHWGLFNRRAIDRQVDVDSLFQRGLPLRIGETTVLRLSAEDHILHACGHLNLHHGGSPELFRYFELAWTIRHADPPVDWPLTLARAAQWRLQIPLRATLVEMERLFPGTLPPETLAALDRLAPDREEQRIYYLLMKYRDTPFVHVLPWRWTPAHLWNSIRFLFEAFIPGPQFLQHRYGEIRFWPLHYLKRAWNSIKQLFAFVQKT